MKAKFKVGDKVVVLRNQPQFSYWFKGDTFVITEISHYHEIYGKKSGHSDSNYVFKDDIELVSSSFKSHLPDYL